MHDNGNESSQCGPMLEASWEFAVDPKGFYYVKLKGEKVKELLKLETDQKLFKILYLDSAELILQYTHRQFSDMFTQITDIYVPEGTPVVDRDFHW